MPKKPYYTKFGYYRGKDNKIYLNDEVSTTALRKAVESGDLKAKRSAIYIKSQTVKDLKQQLSTLKKMENDTSLTFIQKGIVKQMIREAENDISDLSKSNFVRKLENIHTRTFTSSDSITINRITNFEKNYIENYFRARATGVGTGTKYGSISGEEFEAMQKAFNIMGRDFNKFLHDEVIKQNYKKGISQLYEGMATGYIEAVKQVDDFIKKATPYELEQLASISNLEPEIVADITLRFKEL